MTTQEQMVYNFSLTNDTRIMTNKCFHCGQSNSITVDEKAYRMWHFYGRYIQDSFPHLSFEERELIQTGIHPTCWTEIFGDEDDE